MAASPAPAEPSIRPAGRADVGPLVQLRRAVGWSSGGLQGSFAAVDAGRQSILLAERDGELVGAVTIAFHVLPTGGRGHVSDLFVAPLWRRRGIGTALLEAAEGLALARGCRDCTLDVDAHNTAAMALYSGHGYLHHRPAQFPWGSGYTLRKVLGAATPASPRGLFAFWRRRAR